MNNKYIQDLTYRLSHALDQNYDVVNLDAVLSVISALEGATITKEQLETTRLAKYINQLRRRTKSEHLARRAKSLLKKWREMVGIQQQTNESLSNQNVPTSSSTQHHQLYHRSQPTSPIVGTSIVDQMGVNNAEKLSSDFRCFSSNPVITRTSSSQNTNYNSTKLGAVSGTNLSNVSIQSLPVNGGSHVQLSSIASQKQPTSFANLLTGIYSGTKGPTNDSNITDLLSSPSSRKSNKRKERNSMQTSSSSNIAKTLSGLDQSTSNVDLNRSGLMHYQGPISNIAPIVIDIQDSNSDSDLIGLTQTPTTPTSAQPTGSGPTSISKLKKSKRDKKRKERDTQSICSSLLSSSISVSMTNVKNESSSNQQKVIVDPDYPKCVPIAGDEFSQAVYPNAGISEILSLSNSSISSMFPNSTAIATSMADCIPIANTQQKVETFMSSNSDSQTKSISKSELTFAGKFKQHSTANNIDLFTFEGKPTEANTTEVVLNDSNSSHLKPSSTMYSFVPFSASGCNSNDSTSNSRISQFDIIDVVNQDHSQNKILEELRQQHIKPSPISTPQMEAQQKHRNASEQILMPPTPTTNLRQFTNVAEGSMVSTADSAIPKKRGRKKGSKGVDSIIAKETSLCSQILLTSLGCKKVKTTKELYTEMQNRKFGISSTTSSPTMSNWLSHQQTPHISRPNSSCSELSLHSRTSDACSTNATVSTVATRSSSDKIACYNTAHGEIDVTDSETNTSAPSHYSAIVNSHIGRRPSTDSTSNSQLPTKEISTNSTQPLNTVTLASLKQQLKEILSQLPPVPSMETIQWESIKDVVPCTCKVIECELTVDQQSKDYDEEIQGTCDNSASSSLACFIRNDAALNLNQLQKSLAPKSAELAEQNRKECSHSDVKNTQLIKPMPIKPIKSIFDLDFDDDDDPLHQIRAEAAAAPILKKETDDVDIKTENAKEQVSLASEKPKSVSVLATEFSLEQPSIVLADEVSIQIPSPINFPTYYVEEDPKCEAKQRFELQTQNITQFHITALHNCYIPNVNGNWDNAEVTATLAASITAKKTGTTVINEESSYKQANKLVPTIADLWKNVVPQYGSLKTEFIPKDLRHITFTNDFIPKKNSKKDKPYYILPFLGVARKYMKSKESKKKHKIKRDSVASAVVHFDTAYCEGINANTVLLQDSQNVKKETNNNDGVYVKCNINSECVNISLFSQSETKIVTESIHGGSLSCKSIMNDRVLLLENHPSSNSVKLACDNDDGSNAVIYSGITVDITEDVSEGQADGDQQKINSDLNTQDLLTFAKLPCDKSAEPELQSSFYENTAILQSYENQNDQNVNNNSASATSAGSTATVIFAEEKPLSQMSSSSSKAVVDSRRSSSCSNSSLKQTQHSINMKLRRRRLQQQKHEENKKLSTSSHTQKLFGKRSRYKGLETKENKPRIVKTIKLAINGNITSQLPIPMSSSSNTEDDSSQFEDDVMEAHTSRHNTPLTINENIVEEITDGGDCDNDMHGDDDDECDDGDYGYEYADDYEGDYHEVVSRNITGTSSGNNHIVLTIKKTPSKTNSPSNSISSISQLVTSPQELSATKEIEIIEQLSVTSMTKTLNSDNDVVNRSENNVLGVVLQAKMAHENVAIHTQDKLHSVNAKSQDVKNENTTSTYIEIDPSTILISAKCRRQRRMKKTSKISTHSYDYSLSNYSQELNQQLFFRHELDTIGFGRNALDITSCSSSSFDDTDCEYEVVANMHNIENKQSHTTQKAMVTNKTYQNNHKNDGEEAQCDSSRYFSYSTGSSNESGDETSELVVAVESRKKKKIKRLENTNEDLKQSKRQKKKRNRSIMTKRTTNVSDKSGGTVVKTDVEGIKIMEEHLQAEETLALDNNGLLHSFNSIYMTPEQVEQNQRLSSRISSVHHAAYIRSAGVNEIDLGDVVYIDDLKVKTQQQEEQQHPNNNCDAYSNFYNYENNSKLHNSFNNLNNSINSSYKSDSYNENEASTASRDLVLNGENVCEFGENQIKKSPVLLEKKVVAGTSLVPHKEYRTGLRAVDEDVDDEDGNNCGRIQQFKEWHQVLQLRSYNDELLTVMPYVVLD